MAQNKKETGGALSDFTFDEDDDFDFGGSTTKTTDDNDDDNDDEPSKVTKIDDKEKESKSSSKEKKKDENDEDEDDEDDFGEFDEPIVEKKKSKEKVAKKEEEEDEDEKDDKKDTKKSKEGESETEEDFFTDLATDLKEKGIFANIEIPKDKKITEEEFFAMHDDEIESRVTETFEAIFEEMGKEGSDFLQYIKNGGNPSKFLTQVSNRFSLDDLDTDNEAQVSKTLKHYLTVYENMDEDEMADRIQWLKDGGKEKSYAEKYFKAIKANDAAAEKKMLDNQKAQSKEKEDNVKLFNSELKEVADKTEAVGSFNLNKTEQKSLVDYITKPTIKVGKNVFIPEFQVKLNRVLIGKTDKDKQKLLVMAKILKEDFELPDLEARAETKVTKRAISRLASKRGSSTLSTASSGKSLADRMS